MLNFRQRDEQTIQSKPWVVDIRISQDRDGWHKHRVMPSSGQSLAVDDDDVSMWLGTSISASGHKSGPLSS